MGAVTKEERGAKWDAAFYPCKFHPTRRSNRSRYVTSRAFRCAACNKTRIDGTPKPGQTRYNKSEQKYWVGVSSKTMKRVREHTL